MPLALVQHKVRVVSSTNPQATFDTAPTQGNLVVASITTEQTTSGSLTNPSGYTTRADRFSTSLPAGGARIASKIAGASESATVQFGDTSSQAYTIELYEFSGNAVSGSEFDAAITALASTSVSSIQPGSLTPASAGEVFIVAAYQEASNGGGEAINSSFTVLDAASYTAAVHGYKIKTNATAENPSASWTTARKALVVMAAFRAAPTVTDQSVAGTMASSGVLTRRATKVLAGTQTSGGTLTIGHLFAKVLGGTMASTGVLTNSVTRIVRLALAGTMASAGTLTRNVRWLLTLAGTMTSAGRLNIGRYLYRLTRRRRGPTSSSAGRGDATTGWRRGTTNTSGRATIGDTSSEEP